MEWGGGFENFYYKRVVMENEGLPYYIEVFLEIPHDAA